MLINNAEVYIRNDTQGVINTIKKCKPKILIVLTLLEHGCMKVFRGNIQRNCSKRIACRYSCIVNLFFTQTKRTPKNNRTLSKGKK